MKQFLTLIFFATSFFLHAAAPPRGDERLRELVVFPGLDFGFHWNITCENNEYVIIGNMDLPGAIAEQREKLKKQPDDVKQLMHLAYLLDTHDETNEAQLFYQKAEQLCRDKAAANPRDGLSLVELGKALAAVDKNAEAESVFRRATLVSSNEWKCWANLGVFLGNAALSVLFSKNASNIPDSLSTPGRIPSPTVWDQYRPTPELLKKSESLCQEASQCFNRALAIAPKEPEVFFQRAGYLTASNSLNYCLRYYRGEEKFSMVEWVKAFLPPGMIVDLKQASALKPKDYQYLSFAVYSECLIFAMKGDVDHLALNMLPDEMQKSVRAALTRLENLSEDADKKIAVGALENLGILNIFLGNQSGAIANFRRAVKLDPMREQIWGLFIGFLWESASVDELRAAAESQLKARDSARNHIILSKVFAQKLSRWKEAAEQAQIAARQETNDVVPLLMQVAIALKQSSSTNYLSVAETNIINATAILKKMPDGDEKTDRARELMSNFAIYCALVNQPEAAKKYANEILKKFPDDETAKEILKALN